MRADGLGNGKGQRVSGEGPLGFGECRLKSLPWGELLVFVGIVCWCVDGIRVVKSIMHVLVRTHACACIFLYAGLVLGTLLCMKPQCGRNSGRNGILYLCIRNIALCKTRYVLWL